MANRRLFISVTLDTADIDIQKDRIKGPTIFFLCIFLLYITLKSVNYLTEGMEFWQETLALILGIAMIVPTVVFMVYLIRNKAQAKLWLHISASVYLISNIILLVQVMASPYGNQRVTGGTKIGPIPIGVFYILIIAFYWIMLSGHFKKYGEKYL